MKKLIAIFFLIGAFIIINGCEEKLDLKPHEPSMAKYFGDVKTFTRATYGVYAKMPDLFSIHHGDPLYGLWFSPADDVSAHWRYWGDIFDGITAEEFELSGFFDESYELIMRANLVIEKANNNINQFTEDEKTEVNQMKGEALFLRSYWYFKLWQYFGKYIPLIEKRKELGGDVTLADLRPSSAGSDNAILDFCINDLEEAKDLLPEEWPDTEKGRVTDDAAYGLLGKLYVFRACYNDGNQSDYEAAINAFNQIDNHSLVEHYGYNFDVNHENNKESLFEFQASIAPDYEWVWNDNDYDVGHGHMSAHTAYYTNMWNIMYWGEGDFGLLKPTTKLVEAFDTAAVAMDPRYPEIMVVDTNDPWNGFRYVKYVKPDRFDGTGYAAYANTNNYRILRMADVMLLKAEALLQTGQSGALGLVNQIRERARNSVPEGESASAVPADLGSVDMQNIMDERFRELAAEGHRWPDLKRWDAAGYIDLSTWGTEEFSTPYECQFDYPTNLLYPIPADETEQNPNITPTPGY
jgi:hypothetical protein